MSKRRISSGATSFLKYFPLLWLGLLGASIFMIAQSGGVMDIAIMVGMLALATAIVWLLFWTLADEVAIEGTDLVVKKGQRRARFPVSNIERVGGIRWINPERITLTLRSPCELGRKISFMPPIRMFAMFSEHPVRGELERLADV